MAAPVTSPLNLRQPRFWIVGLAATTVLGVLQFSYRYTDVLVRARAEPMHEKLIEEVAGWCGALLVVPIIIVVARRLRDRRLSIAIPMHVAAAVLVSVIHTSWNWGSRVAAFSLLGYGEYDYGIMRLRYFMELPN